MSLRSSKQQNNNNVNSDEEENNPMEMDEWIVESSPCPIPNGAAGLYLLGNICRRSNRKRRAMQYYRMSLQVRYVPLGSILLFFLLSGHPSFEHLKKVIQDVHVI